MFPTLIKDFNVSLTDIGFVYLLQCVVTSIATPFWGMLGDKYSRTLLLGIGCAMWGCFTLGGALSTSFVEFTVFRTVSACFLALVSPLIQSIVADIVAPSHRGRVFGQVSMFGMLGGFCGQFIATTFSNSEMLGLKGWRCCLLIVAIVSFIFTPIVCYTQDYRPSPGRSVQTASNVKNPLKLTTFWILVTQGMFGYVPWRVSEDDDDVVVMQNSSLPLTFHLTPISIGFFFVTTDLNVFIISGACNEARIIFALAHGANALLTPS